MEVVDLLVRAAIMCIKTNALATAYLKLLAIVRFKHDFAIERVPEKLEKQNH